MKLMRTNFFTLNFGVRCFLFSQSQCYEDRFCQLKALIKMSHTQSLVHFGKSALKSHITGNILRSPIHVPSSNIILFKVLCILFFFLEFDPWKIINLNAFLIQKCTQNIFSSCSNLSSTSLLSLFQLCSHEKLQKTKILPAEGYNNWWSLHHDHNCWS